MLRSICVTTASKGSKGQGTLEHVFGCCGTLQPLRDWVKRALDVTTDWAPPWGQGELLHLLYGRKSNTPADTTVRGVALDVIMQVGGERAGGRDPLPLTKSCRPHGWCLRYGTLTYMHQAEEAEAKKSQLIGAVLFGIANQTSAQQATVHLLLISLWIQ